MSSNTPENSAPGRSEGNAQPVPVQPRQPRNMQGLLRFAIEATKAEDAPRHSELCPLNDERRRFLEEALRGLNVVNVVEVVQQAIKLLTNTERMHSIQLEDLLPEDVEISFNHLLDFVDDIDVANDFNKMGGFAIFPVCYGCENAEVRALASAVLADVCQNNPRCQERALECGLLGVLLSLLETERGQALAKCLYAVSCVTREYEPACRALIAQDGCATLAQLLQANESSVRTKAAFLIKYFCNNYSEAKEQFIQENLVRTIVEQIKSGHDESTEHLLSILMSFMEDLNPTVLEQCNDPHLDLKRTIEEHMKHPVFESDALEEEKEYAEAILRILEKCPPVEVSNEEAADR